MEEQPTQPAPVKRQSAPATPINCPFPGCQVPVTNRNVFEHYQKDHRELWRGHEAEYLAKGFEGCHACGQLFQLRDGRPGGKKNQPYNHANCPRPEEVRNAQARGAASTMAPPPASDGDPEAGHPAQPPLKKIRSRARKRSKSGSPTPPTTAPRAAPPDEPPATGGDRPQVRPLSTPDYYARIRETLKRLIEAIEQHPDNHDLINAIGLELLALGSWRQKHRKWFPPAPGDLRPPKSPESEIERAIRLVTVQGAVGQVASSLIDGLHIIDPASPGVPEQLHSLYPPARDPRRGDELLAHPPIDPTSTPGPTSARMRKLLRKICIEKRHKGAGPDRWTFRLIQIGRAHV